MQLVNFDALADARQVKLPPPPDMSKAHEYYVSLVTQMNKMAAAEDLDEFKEMAVWGFVYRNTPGVEEAKRYCDLCIIALEARAVAAARRGKLPPAPIFCYLTGPNRKKRDDLNKLVATGNIAGLKAYKIRPTGAVRKELRRYRDLCIIALEAQQRASKTFNPPRPAGRQIRVIRMLPLEAHHPNQTQETTMNAAPKKPIAPTTSKPAAGATKTDTKVRAAKTKTDTKVKKARPLGMRAQIEADAKAGKLPAPPDFSAATHERFRGKLAELVKLANAGDVKALKAFAINPVSTSPKALDRYRDLCVLALTAPRASQK